VQALAAAADDGDEAGADEDVEVLRGRLAGHAEPGAQLAQRLAVLLAQAVEEQPPGAVGQRAEHRVPVRRSLVHGSIMQAYACMSQRPRPGPWPSPGEP
jgi:hypothetical protein